MKPGAPKVDGMGVKSVVSKSTALNLIPLSAVIPTSDDDRQDVWPLPVINRTGIEHRHKRLEQVGCC